MPSDSPTVRPPVGHIIGPTVSPAVSPRLRPARARLYQGLYYGTEDGLFEGPVRTLRTPRPFITPAGRPHRLSCSTHSPTCLRLVGPPHHHGPPGHPVPSGHLHRCHPPLSHAHRPGTNAARSVHAHTRTHTRGTALQPRLLICTGCHACPAPNRESREKAAIFEKGITLSDDPAAVAAALPWQKVRIP